MRRGRERGASLVEFALILPVLALILLGIVSGGFALSRQNSIENSVREATRFGAINPITDPESVANINTYLGQVLDQAEAGATGDLDDGVAARYLCAAFNDGSGWRRIVETNGAGSRVESASSCFNDAPLDVRRVQVLAKRDSDIELLLANIPVHIEAKSVTRYER